MGTAFTYQGRLMDSNAPADGPYDLHFRLFDGPADGNQLGQSVSLDDQQVIDGYFAAELDFNNIDVFNGQACWLEILVRDGESSSLSDYVVLRPRQQVTATPYAIHARGLFVGRDGQVGIGNTGPTAQLHVSKPYGSSKEVLRLSTDVALAPIRLTRSLTFDATSVNAGMTFGDAALKLNDTSTGDVSMAKAGGNVGIGTDDPQDLLEVWRDTSGSPGIRLTNANADGGSYSLRVGGSGSAVGAGNLAVYDNAAAATRVALDNSGNVGIGTTEPKSRLEVNGDLKVTGAYKGDIGPNRGAPFPRPAYISAWTSVTPGTNHTFYHNLGGNPDDYFVDVSFKSNKIHHFYYGTNGSWGAYWWDLDASQVKVFRAPNDSFVDKVRVRIWVYR